MSIIMSVSGRHACKEYLLPDRKGCRHCVFLDASYFCLKKDVSLELHNRRGPWEMTGEKDLVVIDDTGECLFNKQAGTDKYVECGKVYIVFTSSGEQLEISIRECGEKLFPLNKYKLVEGMIIGRDGDCHICLQGNMRLSRKHLAFECRENEWYVRNLGKNGYYLNGRYSDREQKIGFGDCISILEYKIYIFSNWLAIDDSAFSEDGNRAAKVRKSLEINREFRGRDFLTLPVDSNNKDRPDGAASSFEEEDGRIKIRRSPRSVEKIDNEPISIDRPPDLEETGRESLFLTAGPLMSMSIPMLGGSLFMLYAMQLEQRKLGLSAYSGLVMTGLTIVFSLFWAVAAGRFKEKQDKKRQQMIKEAYKRYLADKDESIRRRYDLTRHVLLCRYPSADICMEYSGFSTMLWARNSYHDDFLCHRLGLGQIPFPTRISVPKEEFRSSDSELWHRMEEICEHYRMMPQLPILLHLSDYRQIGLVGESRREIWELIRILAVQIAAGNCYSEVKAAVFYDMNKDDGTGRPDFFRWLPHLWDQNFRRRYLAGSREEARELAYELSQIFKNRAGNGKVAADGAGDAAQNIPHYILFILEPEYLEGEMLGHYIFEETQQLGLTVLWCVDEREKLPNSCRLIVENTELFQGMYDVTGAFQEKVKIEYDQVNEEKCRCFARRLARMYISEALTGGDIPSEVPFFSLFGVERAEDLDIGERWEKNRTSESMRAVIGLKTGGQAIYLDIHEKYHGPHGLIAGTTGSGKSEMLQTYILSMALNYSPMEINFFLIDYKGGGMAGLFKGLPHICGSISNLSGGLISRALTSIKSENLRRQKLFSGHGVNHIKDYSRLFYEGSVDKPLPHLIIIIDEFAELKKEEPEFMKELISVAQVGRSLGVHLILATQKPAGTVSDNIWSNSRFRICLKVQDRQDSMEMIHRSDAAGITQTGRGYLQVGNDEMFELFQSGWSGAPEENRQKDPVKIIGNNGMALKKTPGKGAELSQNRNYKGKGGNLGGHSMIRQRTQLEAVVEMICQISENKKPFPVRSLWMDPLPEKLFLEEIICSAKADKEKDRDKTSCGKPGIVIGLIDDPENQRQENLSINLDDCGHILVCGSSLSGKSSLIQTFLFSLMNLFSPESVQVYILDFGGGALLCFTELPHLGCLGRPEEKEKQRRIMERLISELDRRQLLLQGGNFQQYRDSTGQKIPLIILVIDGFGGFQEKTGTSFEKSIWRLLKEGENCGILLFVSGREMSAAEIPSTMGGYFRTKICLYMKEVFAYMEVLGCISLPVLPEQGIAGRGVTFFGKRILEFQTAVCLSELNDFRRKQLISDMVKKEAGEYKGVRPEEIRCVPEILTWDSYWQEVRDFLGECGRKGKDYCFLGYDDQSAGLYTLDLTNVYCLTVTGSESGSLNLIRIFMENVRLRDNMQLILLDTGNCFTRFRDDGFLKAYGQTEEEILAIFEMLTGIFSERASGDKGRKEEDYYFCIITGFQRLMEMAYQGETGMDGFLENIWEKGRGMKVVFLGLLDNSQTDFLEIYRAFKLFTADKQGFVSGGSLMEQQLFSCGTLSYEEQLRTMDKRECFVFSNGQDMAKLIVPEIEVI